MLLNTRGYPKYFNSDDGYLIFTKIDSRCLSRGNFGVPRFQRSIGASGHEKKEKLDFCFAAMKIHRD